MTIITRRPSRSVPALTPFAGGPLSSIVDRMFSEPFFTDLPGALARIEEGTLPLDVSEDETNVFVRASVPGFRKEDIEVSVHDGVLTIKADRSEEKEENTERYYRRERSTGSVSRRIALPTLVDEEKAQAELVDGVLQLTLPKVQREQPRRVQIK